MKIKNIFTNFFGKKTKKIEVKYIDTFELIVHNDDTNSFNSVIDSLIDVCDHDNMQAEQCAMLIHRVGRIDVRHGELFDMIVMQEKLKKRGLIASVEATLIEE